jgi:hypothetical protein
MVSCHLSEGSLVQHGGSTTRREGGDEQWHQSCSESCEGLPFPYPSFLPVLHSSLSPHGERYSEHESFGTTDVCRSVLATRGRVEFQTTKLQQKSRVFFLHIHETMHAHPIARNGRVNYFFMRSYSLYATVVGCMI